MGEGACVRVCRRMGQMGVMCRVDIIDYSVSNEYEGGKGSGVTGRGRQKGISEDRRREWKKRAEKIVGGEKAKWGKRGLRRLIFVQSGRGS
jgi:hypothetical protein